MNDEDSVMQDCDDSHGDCSKASALVDRYIDGILETNEQSFLQTHLGDCPGCAHGFEFESSFHVRVQSLTPICMPADVKSHIMLALGFPGITDAMPSSFSAMGSPDGRVDGDISSQFGIPRGDIPRGIIPGSDIFLLGRTLLRMRT